MAATAVRPEVLQPSEELAVTIEESGIATLAFKVWQRGCCPEEAHEEEWLSAEECILMPH